MLSNDSEKVEVQSVQKRRRRTRKVKEDNGHLLSKAQNFNLTEQMSTLQIPFRPPLLPRSTVRSTDTLIHPLAIIVMYITYPHFPAANLIKLIDPEDDDTNAPSKYFDTLQFTSRRSKSYRRSKSSVTGTLSLGLRSRGLKHAVHLHLVFKDVYRQWPIFTCT